MCSIYTCIGVSGEYGMKKFNKAEVTALFHKYSVPNPNDASKEIVDIENVLQLCEDMGTDPGAELDILFFAYTCECAERFVFHKSEFIHGFQKLNVSTVSDLGTALKKGVKALKLNEDFRGIYEFAYRYNVDTANQQKNLKKRECAALWRLFLTGRWASLDDWIDFLRESKKIKVIKEDTWRLLLDFILTFPTAEYKKGGYDPKGSWPTLIDKYVIARVPELA